VQDTVGTVKESFQETVDTVKSAFDLSEQMQKHPWIMVSGAVVVGYLGGRLLMGHSYTALPPASDGSATQAPAPVAARAASAAASTASSAASWIEQLASPLMKQAEGLALGVLAGVMADLVHSSAPEAMRGQLSEMVEQFASSVGTKPLRGLFADDQGDNGHAGQGSTANPPGARKPGSAPTGFTSTSPVL